MSALTFPNLVPCHTSFRRGEKRACLINPDALFRPALSSWAASEIQSHVSRREFLKRSALVTALTGAGCIWTPQNASAQADAVLKVALYGVGVEAFEWYAMKYFNQALKWLAEQIFQPYIADTIRADVERSLEELDKSYAAVESLLRKGYEAFKDGIRNLVNAFLSWFTPPARNEREVLKGEFPLIDPCWISRAEGNKALRVSAFSNEDLFPGMQIGHVNRFLPRTVNVVDAAHMYRESATQGVPAMLPTKARESQPKIWYDLYRKQFDMINDKYTERHEKVDVSQVKYALPFQRGRERYIAFAVSGRNSSSAPTEDSFTEVLYIPVAKPSVSK